VTAASTSAKSRPRFPWGLTIAAFTAFALLLWLGNWQIRRLAWKEGLLAKIAALQHAPPRPLATVLAAPGSADFVRVQVACRPAPATGPTIYGYAVREGRIGWRLMSACHVAAGPYDGILLDRGVVGRLTGDTVPAAATYPPVAAAVGVLRGPGAKPWLGPAMMDGGPGFVALRVADGTSIAAVARLDGLAHPAPYLLAVESATPRTPGVTPAAIPTDIPNNHLVYALTWFALAGILAWFYLAMVYTRYRR
jgi:surfeit locus 1 family protein